MLSTSTSCAVQALLLLFVDIMSRAEVQPLRTDTLGTPRRPTLSAVAWTQPVPTAVRHSAGSVATAKGGVARAFVAGAPPLRESVSFLSMENLFLQCAPSRRHREVGSGLGHMRCGKVLLQPRQAVRLSAPGFVLSPPPSFPLHCGAASRLVSRSSLAARSDLAMPAMPCREGSQAAKCFSVEVPVKVGDLR